MSNDNLKQVLKTIETNLLRMCDPKHPVFRMVIERDGYGLDDNNQPEVVAFHVKLEHLSAVLHLPVAGQTGLVMPSGAALRAQVPKAPVVEQPVVASDLERTADKEAP